MTDSDDLRNGARYRPMIVAVRTSGRNPTWVERTRNDLQPGDVIVANPKGDS